MVKSRSICLLLACFCISLQLSGRAEGATSKSTPQAKTNIGNGKSIKTTTSAVKAKPTGQTKITTAKKGETKKDEKKKVPLKDCGANDMKYVYTPCDHNGDRWRVQVPKTSNCKVKNSAAPVKGIPCSSSCKPGQFLDMAQQKCTDCKAGEYSVGDGKRFQNFEAVPEGFVSKGFETSNGATEELASGEKKENICKDATWKAKDGYLESNGSSCRSVLIYTVDLDRHGNVSFTVRSGDESSLFHVWVENEMSCSRNEYDESSPVSDKMNKYFSVTNDWSEYSMELVPGPNRVYFLAANFENSYPYSDSSESSFDSDSERSTMIKDIVVRGFSSSYNCDKCPPGTYSYPGSSKCLSCPENTYSNKFGATSCTGCSSQEYSFVRATSCEKRAKCSENDYFMVWEPCKDGKTRKNFLWKQPQICSSAGDAVQLPKPSSLLDCPSCNPGQYNNGTACVYCPKNHYGEGSGQCKKCPPRTRDAPGLFYKYWTQYPGEPLHLYCIARPTSGCKTTKGWMVHGEYMDTGSGHSDDAELLLVVTVPEFTKQDNEFHLDFSIDCPLSACRFKIEMMESDSSLHTIRTYEGNQVRTTFTHERHSATAVRYRLVFEKKYLADKQTFKHTASRMKIYSLRITNAKIGGTERCEKCATTGGKNCVTCQPGQYIGSSSCIPCPANTYLENNDNALGVGSCKKCPDGTVSPPGSTLCHSNCLISGSGDRRYNFTALSGLHLITGQKRFTTKGYMYYHQFKVTFCGDKVIESKCEDNATSVEGKGAVAAICRSTIIPDQDTVVSAQSITIGKVLTTIDSLAVSAKQDNSSTIKRSETDELNLKFHSNRVTEVCKDGTYGIIRLVCDPYQPGRGKVVLGDGKSCNSETCDGCTYTFTMKSQHACPACAKNDYEVINTACVEGVKRTHYVWKQPKVCVDDSGVKPADTMDECTIFEKSILDFKVIILAFLLGGIVLALVVLYLCYRNRKLTYNYHRLVDATHQKDGELPAAELCGLEDGEEEEEEIVIAKNKNGTKLMSRLRGMTKKKDRNDFSEFENINLAAQYSDDDDDDEI